MLNKRDLGLVDDERRTDTHHIAVFTCAARVEKYPGIHRRLNYAVGHPCGFVKSLEGIAVSHDLDANKHARAADLGNVRVLTKGVLQTLQCNFSDVASAFN